MEKVIRPVVVNAEWLERNVRRNAIIVIKIIFFLLF